MTGISPTSTNRVYCAGPLFNLAERREMSEIADLLIAAGYDVYLPHRDGMEFRPVLDELVLRGWPHTSAGGFLHAAIFALDIYQLVIECHSVVWNLNGRVPDEGAVSECAMAWMMGKPLIAYKDDFRTLITGRDNPLLAGLVDFDFVSEICKIPEALERACQGNSTSTRSVNTLPPNVQRAVGQGRMLWTAMQENSAQGDNGVLADVVAELFAPKVTL